MLLAGGAKLNTAFTSAGFVDQVILDLESVIIGQGISLFGP
jgi:riboflavin biosynthesis pyrimidine reductase